MPISPELTRVMEAVLRNAAPGSEPSLGEVRDALLSGIVWSDEGELLYAQDCTSFVNELDELIERVGANARARDAMEKARA